MIYDIERFDTLHIKEYPQAKVAWVRPDTESFASVILNSGMVASKSQLRRLNLVPKIDATVGKGVHQIHKGQRVLDIYA